MQGKAIRQAELCQPLEILRVQASKDGLIAVVDHQLHLVSRRDGGEQPSGLTQHEPGLDQLAKRRVIRTGHQGPLKFRPRLQAHPYHYDPMIVKPFFHESGLNHGPGKTERPVSSLMVEGGKAAALEHQHRIDGVPGPAQG